MEGVFEITGYSYDIKKKEVTLRTSDGQEITLPRSRVPLDRIDFIISEPGDNTGLGHLSAIVEIKDGQAYVMGYRDGCTEEVVLCQLRKEQPAPLQKDMLCPVCGTKLPSPDTTRCPGCGEWLEDL